MFEIPLDVFMLLLFTGSMIDRHVKHKAILKAIKEPQQGNPSKNEVTFKIEGRELKGMLDNEQGYKGRFR